MPALTAGTQFVRLSTARLYELVTRRSLLILQYYKAQQPQPTPPFFLVLLSSRSYPLN